MPDPDLQRRRFIAAAITFSGLSLGPPALRLSNAWAQAGGDDPRISDAMTRIARMLAPHDAIADEDYATVIGDALAATAADGSLASAFADAEAALDARQAEPFTMLHEAAQLEALRSIQGESFFASILGAVRLHLYNHPAAWAAIQYEGPSWQKGGYLDRGAGEIDWLPEVE